MLLLPCYNEIEINEDICLFLEEYKAIPIRSEHNKIGERERENQFSSFLLY